MPSLLEPLADMIAKSLSERSPFHARRDNEHARSWQTALSACVKAGSLTAKSLQLVDDAVSRAQAKSVRDPASSIPSPLLPPHPDNVAPPSTGENPSGSTVATASAVESPIQQMATLASAAENPSMRRAPPQPVSWRPAALLLAGEALRAVDLTDMSSENEDRRVCFVLAAFLLETMAASPKKAEWAAGIIDAMIQAMGACIGSLIAFADSMHAATQSRPLPILECYGLSKLMQAIEHAGVVYHGATAPELEQIAAHLCSTMEVLQRLLAGNACGCDAHAANLRCASAPPPSATSLYGDTLRNLCCPRLTELKQAGVNLSALEGNLVASWQELLRHSCCDPFAVKQFEETYLHACAQQLRYSGQGVASFMGVLKDALDAASPPDTPAAFTFTAKILQVMCSSFNKDPAVLERLARAYADTKERLPRLLLSADAIVVEAVEMIHRTATDVRRTIMSDIVDQSTPVSAAVLEQLLPLPLGAALWFKSHPSYLSEGQATIYVGGYSPPDPTIKLLTATLPLLHTFRNPVPSVDMLAQLCSNLIANAGDSIEGAKEPKAAGAQLLDIASKLHVTPLPASCILLDATLKSRPPTHNLASACWVGDVEGVEAAIACGADATVSLFEPPLVIAAAFGHVRVIQCLLTHLPRLEDGSWPPLSQTQVNAALTRACAMEHAEAAEVLLTAAGCRTIGPDGSGSGVVPEAALQAALAAGGHPAVTRALAKHGVPTIPAEVFSQHDALGAEAFPRVSRLQYACLAGSAEDVKREFAAAQPCTWEVLCSTVVRNTADTATSNNGPGVESSATPGATGAAALVSPLSLAVLAHNVDAVTTLLQFDMVRANIDWVDGQYYTALHYAAMGEGARAVTIIHLLGAAGADPNRAAGFFRDGYYCPNVVSMMRLWSKSHRSPSEEVGRALLAIGTSPIINVWCSCHGSGPPHTGHAALELIHTLYNAPKISVLLEGLSHEELHAVVPEVVHGHSGRAPHVAVLADRIRAANSTAFSKIMCENITFSRRMAAVAGWVRENGSSGKHTCAPRRLHESFGLLRAASDPAADGLLQDVVVLSASMPPEQAGERANLRNPVLFGIPRTTAALPEHLQTAPVPELWRYMSDLTPAAMLWAYTHMFEDAVQERAQNHLQEADCLSLCTRMARTVTSSPIFQPLMLTAVTKIQELIGRFPVAHRQLVPYIERMYSGFISAISGPDWRHKWHDVEDPVKLFQVQSAALRDVLAGILAEEEADADEAEADEGSDEGKPATNANLCVLLHMAATDKEALRLAQRYLSGLKQTYDIERTVTQHGWRVAADGTWHRNSISMCFALNVKPEAKDIHVAPLPPAGGIPFEDTSPDQPVSGGHFMSVPCGRCKDPVQALLDIDLTDARMKPLFDALGGLPRLRVPHCCACFCDDVMSRFMNNHLIFDLQTCDLNSTSTSPRYARDDGRQVCAPDERTPVLSVGCITLGANEEGVHELSGNRLGGTAPHSYYNDFFPMCHNPDCNTPMVYIARLDGESVHHGEGAFHVSVCTACCRKGAVFYEHQD